MGGTRAAELFLPDRRASRRQFDRAAGSFAEASFVHDEARERLLERLQYQRVRPAVVADLGTAHGGSAAALKALYPSARVIGIDSSMAMLTRAGAGAPGCALVHADAQQLPLGDQSVDLTFANLVLPWCDPRRLFCEVSRVTKTSGAFMFTTLGPDSLAILARAWARVDELAHVHAFIDMHDLGDALVWAGLEDVVMDVDRINVSYRNLASLVRDLKSCGARNVAGGRRRTLTAPGRWHRFECALAELKGTHALEVGIELIFGHAFGHRARRARPTGEVVIPVDDLGRGRAR